jgi:hypothetical protein
MKVASRNLAALILLASLCGSASGTFPPQSDLEQSLIQQAPKINPEILDLALRSYVRAEQEGLVDRN